MPETMRNEPSRTYARESSFLSLLSGWVQQGIESFIATQRILVDLAIRQNANAMEVIRERLADPDICPVAIISELAGEGITNFIEAQRILLSLVQSENEILMKGVKERVGVTKVTAAMTDMARRSIDNFLRDATWIPEDCEQANTSLADGSQSGQGSGWCATSRCRPGRHGQFCSLAEEVPRHSRRGDCSCNVHGPRQ